MKKMLSEYDMGQALIKLCLEDTSFDIILFHETDYMKWVASMRVLENALDQSIKADYTPLTRGGIPCEKSIKKYDSKYLRCAAFVIEVPTITDIDYSILSDAYERYVKTHFHPIQMNIFFLHSVKYRPHFTTSSVEFSFLFRHEPDFKTDPVNVVRRFYQCYDNEPVEVNTNKRLS